MEIIKTISLKLEIGDYEKGLIDTHLKEYTDTLNGIMINMVEANNLKAVQYKDIAKTSDIPTKCISNCLLDCKSAFLIYKSKLKKNKKQKPPVFKKKICKWTTQAYKLKPLENKIEISFRIIPNERPKRIPISLNCEKYKDLLSTSDLGTLRITKKGTKYIAQIPITIPCNDYKESGNILGVDLGIKKPAALYCSNGNKKFIGNGKENKFIRRRYKTLRKTLGKSKKIKTIKKLNNKEQRIMKDKDHKYSREIIDFAIQNNCYLIRLEKLDNIRKTTRTSRKNNYSLHSWSFYRLATYIEYKAQIAGIKVEYVNPAYTSQTCPNCGERNKMPDRKYECKNCGYVNHRDIVGAINICKNINQEEEKDDDMTKEDGNSLLA